MIEQNQTNQSPQSKSLKEEPSVQDRRQVETALKTELLK
jgi:SWI/SNF-related matrix-associated actin-dependent regulator of chromatin subfamily D